MSIDLRATPFCLSDAQIGWVQDALVEKLMGRDTFRGKSPTDPFCGKEYLQY